jgi:O-antigen chain-terminating methyltransferase
MARAAKGEIDTDSYVKSREHASNSQPDPRSNGGEKAKSPNGLYGKVGLPKSFDYFLFEHRHRGSVLDIKRRQSTYLDLFRGRNKVVDLGCGRGEFVELLTENGINVTGVDISEDMVDFCRDRGLTVVHADLFDYLTGLPDGEPDGIFLSQVVEHLAPEQILNLLLLCAQKLESGGVIVIETVNTNCPTAMSNFYIDPTHVRPVPPEMLRFMVEQASLQVKYLRFTSPLPGNDHGEVLDLTAGMSPDVMVYQDYAIVAIKP